MNKGKIRTRRLTIRAKILIPSIIIVVLVCGLMGYNSYTRFEKSMVGWALRKQTWRQRSLRIRWMPSWYTK